METPDSEQPTDGETVNEGAVRAGTGRCFFDPEQLEGIDPGGDLSSAHGPIVEGEKVQVGVIEMPAGTGAKPHTHPNEQFIYLLQGTLRVRVADEEDTLPAGSLIYFPPGVEHSIEATEEEDVHFFTTKDLSHGMAGRAVSNDDR